MMYKEYHDEIQRYDEIDFQTSGKTYFNSGGTQMYMQPGSRVPAENNTGAYKISPEVQLKTFLR